MLRFTNAPEISRNMIPGSIRDKISVPLFVTLTFALSWTCWFFAPRFAHIGLYIQILGYLRREFLIRTLLIYLGNFVPSLLALALCIGLAGRGGLWDQKERLRPPHLCTAH